MGAAANETISVKIDEMSSKSLDASYTSGKITLANAVSGAAPSFSATGASADGKYAIEVYEKGWTEARTYSVDVKKGESEASATAKLATLINDANIGISAHVSLDTTGGVVTGSLDLVSVKGIAATSGAANETSVYIKGQAAAPGSTGTVTKTVQALDITSVKGSQEAIITIDKAIQSIDAQRADLGAVQNRFENTIGNLQNIAENVSAARGRIQDTDFASETANLSKQQILQQAGTAILAQANQLPQAVLSLLQ